MSAAGLWAHPRSRGEHLTFQFITLTFQGSSPLARGTRRRNSDAEGVRGLIPARAGNTMFGVLSVCLLWAHPRSRGEHSS